MFSESSDISWSCSPLIKYVIAINETNLTSLMMIELYFQRRSYEIADKKKVFWIQNLDCS